MGFVRDDELGAGIDRAGRAADMEEDDVVQHIDPSTLRLGVV